MTVSSPSEAVPGPPKMKRSGSEGRAEQRWLWFADQKRRGQNDDATRLREVARLTGFRAQQINLALDDLNPRFVPRDILSSFRCSYL